MLILAGTSGFSYKEWKGVFYPERLPANRMLAAYASRLPAVEINNTFHRLPSQALLEGWRAQVPRGFRFALKAPRRLTHIKRLADCGPELAAFFAAAETLGEAFASTLFQLPPHFRADRARLADFVLQLPAGAKASFEFRNDSWFDDGIYEVLASRNLALAIGETGPESRIDLPWTADWAYLRLRKPDYSDVELEAWLERLRRSGVREAQVFFKHEDEARGPRFAERFLALAVGAAV